MSDDYNDDDDDDDDDDDNYVNEWIWTIYYLVNRTTNRVGAKVNEISYQSHSYIGVVSILISGFVKWKWTIVSTKISCHCYRHLLQ